LNGNNVFLNNVRIVVGTKVLSATNSETSTIFTFDELKTQYGVDCISNIVSFVLNNGDVDANYSVSIAASIRHSTKTILMSSNMAITTPIRINFVIFEILG